MTAFGIFTKNQLAQRAGVAFAFLNALAQLPVRPAYPFWSLVMLPLEILAMYGLVRYMAVAHSPPPNDRPWHANGTSA